jgi:hypothetical protein
MFYSARYNDYSVNITSVTWYFKSVRAKAASFMLEATPVDVAIPPFFYLSKKIDTEQRA